MLDPTLVEEADRQFTICNACRYCEGLCTVFPAMELRTAFESGDVSYLSTLCHDCRACLDACPFSTPHEFAIDIPTLMATARAETFSAYARPQAAWRLATKPTSLWALVGLWTLFFAVVVAATHGLDQLFDTRLDTGGFYRVIAYLWLLVPVLLLSGIAAIGLLVGVWQLAADTHGGVHRLLDKRAHLRAIRDVLELRNLRGGGGECNYPGDTVGATRRRLHHLVFYGFGTMFAATIAAAIEQDVLGTQPPFPFLSVPVLLGTIGGLSTLSGCIGFLVFGMRQRDTRKIAKARSLDRSFTILLFVTTLTGFLVLALRGTPALGIVLVLHLGVLAALLLTLPYSKFVHGAYRYTALVRAHAELAGKAND